MANNLLKAVADHHAKKVLLVTGGYHAAGIERATQEAGLTTVAFVPKLTTVETDKGSAYLSVFSQEKTPLDKLLQGERLFLSPRVNPPGLNTTLRLLAITLDTWLGRVIDAAGQVTRQAHGLRRLTPLKAVEENLRFI